MDYTELVEALWHCYEDDDACATCQRWLANDEWGIKCKGRLISDAAAAIEALQAEIRESMQKCAECGDRMVEPKRGKWLIHSTGGSMATKKCPFCGSESWQSKEYAKVPKYCENCGAHLPTFDIVDWVHYLHAKTEVQE